MRRQSVVILLSILLISSLVFSGCAKESEIIKIGAIGPLTGESSIGGQDELAGKEMAVEEVNQAGGVLGKKVELVSEDDASQPSQSASVAMKLINQDKVVAIVGAHNSPCTMAVLEVIERYGVPIITPGSSSPKVTSVGCDLVTRSFPSDAIQAQALVNYAVDELGIQRPGIIYVNDDYGQGGLAAIQEAFVQKNLSLIGAEAFMGSDKDMTSQLTKLRGKDIDALFVWCQYLPASLIMKQTREMGWDVRFLAGTGSIHPKTFELAGTAYDGTIHSVPFIPNIPDPIVQDFVKKFEEKYNRLPSQNVARAYDATRMLLAAIEKAGSLDKEAINKALRNTKDFPGLQGKITIDPETGEYIGDVMIVKANVDQGDYEFLLRVGQ